MTWTNHQLILTSQSHPTRCLPSAAELLEALGMVMACAGDISAAPDGMLEMALDDGDEETRRQANAFLVARAAIAKAEGVQHERAHTRASQGAAPARR